MDHHSHLSWLTAKLLQNSPSSNSNGRCAGMEERVREVGLAFWQGSSGRGARCQILAPDLHLLTLESWENQKQFPSTHLPQPIILGKPHADLFQSKPQSNSKRTPEKLGNVLHDCSLLCESLAQIHIIEESETCPHRNN